ncbi:MAG: tetratricopeptide repeat protein [Pirellulales bacterium]
MLLIARRYLLLFVLSITLSNTTQIHSAEPVEAFLGGLLERGYYDQAILYLDRVAENPNLSADIKKSLDYRKAVTQIEASRGQRNAEMRDQLLTSADANLSKFLKENPKHVDIVDATIQRGNLLLEQAKLAELQADGKKDAKEKAAFLKKSSGKYDAARKVFQGSIASIKKILTDIPKLLDPVKEAKKIERRDEMRSAYMQCKLLATTCLFEKAKLSAPGSEQQKTQVNTAIKEFGETYSSYKSKLAGLYARLYQGQGYQLLKDYPKAVAVYKDDLMLLPDRPEGFRRVKMKGVKNLIECWMDDSEKKYKQIREICGKWLETQQFRPSELRDPDWLELKFLIAKSYLAESEAMKKGDEGKAEIKKSGQKLIVDVARYPGPYQKEAIELKGTSVAADDAPKTFEEAVSAGREAVTEAQSQSFVLKKLRAKLASKKTPAAEKKTLKAEISTTQEAMSGSYKRSRTAFTQAVNFADYDTPSDDLNSVRYYLCYLDFLDKSYHRSFVMGDFVSRRYPTSSSAKTCAKLALASYLMIYESKGDADKSFELNKIQESVGFMAKQWPGEPETNEALATLVGFQIQEGKLAEAELTLNKIPKDSDKRPTAELKIGQTSWSYYLKGMEAHRVATRDKLPTKGLPTQKQLTAAKEKALSNLENGVSNFSGNDVTYTYVIAALSLAQIHADLGTPRKAIPVLEGETRGLLHLIESNSKAIPNAAIKQLIYKGAVRVYVSSLSGVKSQAEADKMMEKALKVMDELKTLVGEDAAGQKQLIAIYISLARDLKQQLENTPAASKEALAKGFETFLDRVADSTNDLTVLNWVGETFYNLGMGAKTQDGQIPADAKSLFEKSSNNFEKVISKGKDDASINPQLLLQAKMRVAMVQRALGDYETAMAAFTEVLTENSMMINVQMEAAQTYHDWGLSAKDQKKFVLAMMGSGKDPKTKKNAVWGWGQIQATLARFAVQNGEPNPYRAVFFESRYRLAFTRYEYAKAFTDAASKEKYLASAKKDINVTASLYPDLGGEALRAKFDGLLRKIQKENGDPVTGLKKNPA